MAGPCPPSADYAFGPIVHGCNHADFTLLFEQSILSIAPSALLLFVAPLRTFALRQKPTRILKHRGLFTKLTVLILLAVVELALLVQWAVEARVRTVASIPAAVLAFISTLALVVLSYAEHTRCVRPSAIINIYLALSLLLDIPEARTLLMREAPQSIAALFICAMILKVLALLLEGRNKKGYLLAPYQAYSPEALSSIINRSFQWWINPLFFQGFRRLLSIDQLFPTDHRLASQQLVSTFNVLWPRVKVQGRKHPLRRLLALQLRTHIASTMLPRILLIGFKFCQPFLINRVTSVLSSDAETATYNNFLIPAAGLIYGGLAICSSLYKVQMSRLKAMTRGILVSSIYGKTILSSDTGNKSPLTLMTNDTARITTIMERLLDGMVGSSIEIVVALVMLQKQIGWVCIVPIILSAIASVWGFWNSGAAAPLQRAWVSASEQRITFTAKILAFPKAFKILSIADILRDQIQEYRYKETELSKPMTRFGVLRNVIGHAPQIYAPPATLAVAVLVQGHGHLNVETAFTTLSIIALLTTPVENFVQSIPMLGAVTALLDRIEEFIAKQDSPEQTPRLPLNDSELGIELHTRDRFPPKDAFRFEHASFSYSEDETIIPEMDTTIGRDALTLVYGPVGCGKTTFLRAMVGSLKAASGSVLCTAQPISYCAQETWLPNLSIQNIVTLETDPDIEWYNTVIEACSLLPDIQRLPEGDQTIVGSKGVQLSGGQRQRIALARALYARNEILIADDVLSGLDAITSTRIFERLFGPHGLCKQHRMTVLIATHNKQFASRADNIIMFGSDGKIVSQGPYELVNHHLQAANLTMDANHTDKEQSTIQAEVKHRIKPTVSDIVQDRTRKTGDLSLYAYYIKNIGLVHGLLFIVPACIFTFCLGFPTVWLKWWAEDATKSTEKNGLYIGLYFVFALGSSVLGGLAMVQFTSVIVPLSGRRLHRYLLDAVLHAPYTSLASIDTGVILNRFSQDMVMIDANLASSAFMAIMFVLQAIVEGALIVSGSVYLTAIIPAILAVLYGIQYVYLRTSRQLRFLELEAQAPLQTHFLESIDGLATIRSFKWQEWAQAKTIALLDTSQRPFYLLLCAQVWLGLVLDLVVAGVAILIVTIALNATHNTSAGSIGVSLISILTFSGTLTNLIQAWTSMETSLGAVARVKDFQASMVSEDVGDAAAIQPPEGWPTGEIHFNRVFARYNADDDPVLFDFDLHIKPGEKIGICGRSGSGKSSVILALFRMLDIHHGSVTLDGINNKQIHSHTLRSHLNIVPQEPVLLPGSLRFNLDPFGKASDEEIVSVLDRVGLNSILNTGTTARLEAPLEQSSLSVGQQQLLNVARAMLRKTKILVLDEATSSIDSVTEERIMELVQDNFQDCTVIAVAHRLKTLMGHDRIIVMDNGRIAEIGTPQELLSRVSIFKQMCDGIH